MALIRCYVVFNVLCSVRTIDPSFDQIATHRGDK